MSSEYLAEGIPATAQAPKDIYCTSCKNGYRSKFCSCGRLKKANFSDRENIRLLEDVQANCGLLTQSLKTGSVVLKKREMWTKIAEYVNAVGGQGRAVSAIKKRWKHMRLGQRQRLARVVDLYNTRTLFSLSWVKIAIISTGFSSVLDQFLSSLV